MAALLLLLLRKASSLSSPVARLATGPPGFSSSYLSLFSPGCVPFSSDISCDNIVEKIDDEIASYSNDLHMPEGFPFYLNATVASGQVYMSRRYQKEIITVGIDGDDPSVPINVLVNTMDVEVSSTMSAKPNKLDIHEVTIRDKNQCVRECCISDVATWTFMGEWLTFRQRRQFRRTFPATVDFRRHFSGDGELSKHFFQRRLTSGCTFPAMTLTWR